MPCCYPAGLPTWPSLRADLSNAGAKWVDREVVVDKGLISSRKPADIPAFNRQMLAQFDQVRTGHSKRAAAGV